MGMSDEMMRKMDKRSKEEKEEFVGRMMADKTPKTEEGNLEEKSGMMAKIWGVVRKLAGQRSPK